MHKSQVPIYWVVSILFLVYVILCALNVPLTVDEAWTYVEFVKGDFWNVVTYAHPVANNHILNSLLTKPFAAVSNSELSLRMPNVLAYILYLYASYKISILLFENRFFQLALFIALQCNISMLQFFALCRGYGLSIGLMMFSLCQLIQFVKNPNRLLSAHLSLLTAVLAMYASFTLLYFLSTIFLAVFVVCFKAYAKSDTKKFIRIGILVPILYSSFMLLLCYVPVMNGIRAGEFYWGGMKNFVDDTLFTFLQDMIGYDVADKIRDPAMGLLILLVLFSIAVPFIKLHQRNKLHIVAPLILLWCIFCMNIQFYFFTGKIIMHRTALFLFPLIIVSAFSGVSVFSAKKDKTVRVSFGLLTISLLLIFIARLNLQPVEEWWFEADNKKVLKDIVTASNTENRRIKLLPLNFASNSVNYYIKEKYRNNLEDVPNMSLPDSLMMIGYDYLYLKTSDSAAVPMSSFDIVHYYCNAKMTLYRRKSINRIDKPLYTSFRYCP
jgi:hypothetical protein